MPYIELYQHPAASLIQCIFAWLLITELLTTNYSIELRYIGNVNI